MKALLIANNIGLVVLAVAVIALGIGLLRTERKLADHDESSIFEKKNK